MSRPSFTHLVDTSDSIDQGEPNRESKGTGDLPAVDVVPALEQTEQERIQKDKKQQLDIHFRTQEDAAWQADQMFKSTARWAEIHGDLSNPFPEDLIIAKEIGIRSFTAKAEAAIQHVIQETKRTSLEQQHHWPGPTSHCLVEQGFADPSYNPRAILTSRDMMLPPPKLNEAHGSICPPTTGFAKLAPQFNWVPPSQPPSHCLHPPAGLPCDVFGQRPSPHKALPQHHEQFYPPSPPMRWNTPVEHSAGLPQYLVRADDASARERAASHIELPHPDARQPAKVQDCHDWEDAQWEDEGGDADDEFEADGEYDTVSESEWSQWVDVAKEQPLPEG